VSLPDEIAWWSFYLPRQAVQSLARRLPLAELRDRLPLVVGEKLRFGLYPARVTDPKKVECERRHPAWGDPAELDEQRPIRFATAPRVSILMVTYNNLALNRLCLAALHRAAGELPFEIIVVDNQSTDGTPAWLTTQAQRGLLPLEVALNDENRGFAAANNQAAAIARGEILVFLNNDTVVTPGWLEHLVAHLDRDPGLGLVGPVTNSCGNAAEVPVEYRTIEDMLRFAAGYTAAHAGELKELPMLTLFCTAMPRALWREVGGLDERYRVGMFEDDDLAMAVKQRGRRVVLARDAFVHHYGGAAFSRLPPRQYLRIWWENRRRFEEKWGATWQKR
jgi:GT2 family glycosyltransferase